MLYSRLLPELRHAILFFPPAFAPQSLVMVQSRAVCPFSRHPKKHRQKIGERSGCACRILEKLGPRSCGPHETPS